MQVRPAAVGCSSTLLNASAYLRFRHHLPSACLPSCWPAGPVIPHQTTPPTHPASSSNMPVVGLPAPASASAAWPCRQDGSSGCRHPPGGSAHQPLCRGCVRPAGRHLGKGTVSGVRAGGAGVCRGVVVVGCACMLECWLTWVPFPGTGQQESLLGRQECLAVRLQRVPNTMRGKAAAFQFQLKRNPAHRSLTPAARTLLTH